MVNILKKKNNGKRFWTFLGHPKVWKQVVLATEVPNKAWENKESQDNHLPAKLHEIQW